MFFPRSPVASRRLAVVTAALAFLSACSVPSASQQEATSRDAAAVVGLSLLAAETPWKTSDKQKAFQSALSRSRKDPAAASALDLGVAGLSLRNYRFDPAAGTACFEVTAADRGSQAPRQRTWAAWIDHGRDASDGFILLRVGLSSCADAEKAAAAVETAAERRQVTDQAQALIEQAYNAVPDADFTTAGRGLRDKLLTGPTVTPTPSGS